MRKLILTLFLTLTIFFANINSINASDEFIETKTKDKIMFVQGDDGKFNYSWSFDKKDFTKNKFDFDLDIKLSNDFLKVNDKKQIKKRISFDYHGALPSTATIKVPVSDSFKDGDILSLYYYNEEKQKEELVNERIKVINGYVTFEIEHCSEYFVTLSIVNKAGQSGSNNGMIIVGMIIVIIGLVGYTIFKDKK